MAEVANIPKLPRQQLAYAAPLRLWQRRRFVRKVIILTLLLALPATVLLWKDLIWPRVHAWNVQRQLRAQWEHGMAYTAPPNQVVYEEDPAKASVLAGDSVHYIALNYAPDPPVARRWPPDQPAIIETTMGMLPSMAQAEATLFFHERNNPHMFGERQLLILCLEYTRAGVRDSQNIWSFHATSIMPTFTGAMGFRQCRLEVLVPIELSGPSENVRFFAGQPDPVDESHFTVRYEVNDQAGIMDGWLDPQSRVVLKIRDGPATRPVKPKP